MPKIIKGGVEYGSAPNSSTWEGTQAQYDAIVSPDPNVTYFITDGVVNPMPAKNVEYDNTLSGFSSTNVQNVINEIGNMLSWKSLGDTTGTSEIAEPSNWNEMIVYGRFGGNSYYGFVSHIIKAHTVMPYRFIEGGADKDSGNDHHFAIWHYENNKLGIDMWRYNNTDYTSTSKLIIYYR